MHTILLLQDATQSIHPINTQDIALSLSLLLRSFRMSLCQRGGREDSFVPCPTPLRRSLRGAASPGLLPSIRGKVRRGVCLCRVDFDQVTPLALSLYINPP